MIIIGIIFVLCITVWCYISTKHITNFSVKEQKRIHTLFVGILVILALAFILVGWLSLHEIKRDELLTVTIVFLSGLVAIIASRVYRIVNAYLTLMTGGDKIDNKVWQGFRYTIGMIAVALVMILLILWGLS